MIPNPGHPSQEHASRAMSQADEFVRRTRQQAQQAMQQQHQMYTGGAQPGVMGYAAGGAALAAGGLMRGGQAAMAGGATAMGMGAAVAQPITNQVMMAGAGARGGMMPQGFFGLLTTAYAPQGMLPHAATSFHMERGLRREFAREELGRRYDMFGRRAMTTAGDLFTLGISSHIMRRTGVEARLFTEMSTERVLQQRMGVLRGQGQYGASTGFGVRRGFLTEGRGAGAMEELMGGAQSLQARFGYSGGQLDALTGAAVGAVDVTRVRRMAGRPGGMREMGREMREIRETLARTARELQLTEEEMPKFINQLKSTMQVTANEFRSFREETRRVARAGPFSQRQASEMGMQFMQFGRGQYFDPTRFRGEAFSRALEVAELRERGVISRDTLLREGGRLDQGGMMRMLMQRMQIQASAVQGGQFNQELILAGGNQGGYNAMMQGAGFFQTQGAVAGTLMRDPFALLRARLNPRARERVTQDAPLLAYRKVQQLIPMLPGGEDQAIAMFGQRFGMTPEQAQPWYQEQQLQLAQAQEMAKAAGLGGVGGFSDFLVGFGRRSGFSTREITNAARVLRTQGDLGTGAGREQNITSQVIRMRAGNVTRSIERLLGGNRAQAGMDVRLANLMLSGGKIGVGTRGNEIDFGQLSESMQYTDLGYGMGGMPEARPFERMKRRWGVGAADAIDSLRKLVPGIAGEDLSAAFLGAAGRWQTKDLDDPNSIIQRSDIKGGLIAVATRTRFAIKDSQIVKQVQSLHLNNELYARWGDAKGRAEILAGDEGWTGTEKPLVEMGFEDQLRASLEITKLRGTGVSGGIIQRMMGGSYGFNQLRGQAAGGFGMLGRITGGKYETRPDFNKLLAMDEDSKQADKFAQLSGNRLLRPLRGVIEAFTETGELTGAGGFAALRGAVKEKDIQALVKRFGGSDIKAGPITADAGAFGKFIKSLGPERKEFASQMLMLAMGQSDRLVKASKLGSNAGNAMWIRWAGQEESEGSDVGEGKKK